MVAIYSCNFSKEKIDILGKVTGYPDSTAVFLTNIEIQARVDTSYVINNKFRFTVSKSIPTPYLLTIGNQENLFFFVENEDISLNSEKGKIKYANVDGGETQVQLNTINKILYPLNERFDNVHVEWSKAYAANDMEKAKSLERQENDIIHERIVLGAKYIKENPNNLMSAFALQGYIPGLPKSEIRSLYENLSPKIKESDYAKSVLNYLETSKEVKIGDIAEGFHLPDLAGNLISLKDYKGKYVLLEFWEAGCRGCRIENKNLLTEYKMYNDKGFEIISVTADRNKNNWEIATKEDSISWASLQDFKAEDGRVGTIYNVKLLPSNFLIDPDGRIVAIDLRGEKLREKLKELFND